MKSLLTKTKRMKFYGKVPFRAIIVIYNTSIKQSHFTFLGDYLPLNQT